MDPKISLPNSTNLANSPLDVKVVARVSAMHERHARRENMTQAYCDSILGLCVAANDWDSVLQVMEIMRDQNMVQEHSTYRACLQSCFELSNGHVAQQILEAMRTTCIEPDSLDIALVVVTMCRSEKIQTGWYRKALQLLQTTAATVHKGGTVVPVEAYDAVLSCMVQDEQWKEALRLLNAMEQGFTLKDDESLTHPLPLVSTYRIVIETCVQALQPEQASHTLLSMSKRGLVPTAYTFEIVISALANKLQWRRALQLLELMDEMEVPKSIVTYNSVLSACAKAGEVGMANNLMRKMRNAGFTPNIVSFNSIMSACVRTSRWKEALFILDQCQREPGVYPDIITYTNAIRACVKGGKTQKALTLLQVIKDKGLPLDNYAYAAAIDACAKGRMWKKGLDLLDEMERFGVSPNEIAYSTAITACGNGGQWQKAMDLLEQMKDKKMNINLITYNSAITALAKAARNNARQSVKDYSTKRFALGNDDIRSIDEEQLWTRAVDILGQMTRDRLEPDGFSFSATISCCGSGGRWEEALKLIKMMQSGGPMTRPNKISYTAAIGKSLASKAQHAKAESHVTYFFLFVS
jgi:pentatricopeptide repeat protein